MKKEKIICSNCGDMIDPLSPSYFEGEIVCKICYIKKKSPNSQPRLLAKKIKEAENQIKIKKEEFARKEKFGKQIKQRKKDIEDADKLKEKRKSLKRYCISCGKVFYPKRNNPRYKFCSRKCAWNHYYLNIFLDCCPKCGKKKKRTAQLCHSCNNKKLAEARDNKTGRFISS